MTSLKVILIALTLTYPILSTAGTIEPIPYEKITTRFGTVTSNWIDDSQLADIKVNGKVIYKSGVGGFNLYGIYKLKDSDAVLLGENCVCSNQDSDHFYLLVLTPNHSPKLITDESFHSSNFTLEPKQLQDTIFVNLGYENGKQKTAEFKSGKLTVHLVATATRMNKVDCEDLYDQSSKNCTRSISIGLECKYADPSDGSAAGMTGIRILSQLPGYNSSAMSSVCRTECETAKPITYEKFKKDVCSIK